MDAKTIARFWNYVERRGPDECWPWLGARDKKGYGFGHFRKTIRAHRIAFFIANGRWTESDCCHSCDNPPCCNPAHLWEGTRLQNMRDMVAKGRSRKGIRHSDAKLSEADVARVIAARGVIQGTVLAKQFGVHKQSIYQIWWGRTWRHLA